jgi:hypothetical protein
MMLRGAAPLGCRHWVNLAALERVLRFASCQFLECRSN